MIKITHGNILKADAAAIANTVNCVGVMGKGLALQFKKAYPDNLPLTKKRVRLAQSSQEACSF
jgi:O-acetyl-ADP-ribose deacetylase (regulator of RNase III)